MKKTEIDFELIAKLTETVENSALATQSLDNYLALRDKE